MEHIIWSNIMSHVSQLNVLYNLQHGFRNKRCCETQLLEFAHDIVSNIQDGFQTDVCVLDFSKAVDKVGHQRLVESCSGIMVSMVKLIDGSRTFLTTEHTAVVVDGATSDSIPVRLQCTTGICARVVFGLVLHQCYCWRSNISSLLTIPWSTWQSEEKVMPSCFNKIWTLLLNGRNLDDGVPPEKVWEHQHHS